MSAAHVAAVLRHYTECPADRAEIGTHAGHQRLTTLLNLSARPSGSRSSRRRIIGLTVGAVLAMVAGVSVQTITESAGDRLGAGSHLVQVPSTLFVVLGLVLAGEALHGIRGRRRHPHRR